MTREPGRRLLAAMVLALLAPVQGRAQSHSAFPVDIRPGASPQPVLADGRTHLVYELRLTNFSQSPIDLLTLDVLGGGGGRLAGYRGEELDKLIMAVGPSDTAARARTIGGGRTPPSIGFPRRRMG